MLHPVCCDDAEADHIGHERVDQLPEEIQEVIMPKPVLGNFETKDEDREHNGENTIGEGLDSLGTHHRFDIGGHDDSPEGFRNYTRSYTVSPTES